MQLSGPFVWKCRSVPAWLVGSMHICPPSSRSVALVEDLRLSGHRLVLEGRAAPSNWITAALLSHRRAVAGSLFEEYGVEYQIRAKRTEYEVLETSSELATALAVEVSAAEQQTFCDDVAGFKRHFLAASDAWERGDCAALEGIAVEQWERFPNVMRGLNTERHKVGLPKIERQIDEHAPVVIVVGAAHLVGPTSLLRDVSRSFERCW